MIRSLNELYGYTIVAKDGDIGKVREFLFDDRDWVIRYLVTDTGGWLKRLTVLLVPSALGKPDFEARKFAVSISREQVENSPGIDMDKPVYRQHETELHEYYGWIPYWPTPTIPAGPQAVYLPVLPNPKGTDREVQSNAHLRSTREVTGYRVHADDGEIGHVEDFLADDAEWSVRYVAVDTRNWLPGRKVLMAPDWIKHIDWPTNEVMVDHTREAIENSPPYDLAMAVNRQYEERLYDFYGRAKYWRKDKRK